MPAPSLAGDINQSDTRMPRASLATPATIVHTRLDAHGHRLRRPRPTRPPRVDVRPAPALAAPAGQRAKQRTFTMTQPGRGQTPHPVDLHVGRRVRGRRKLLRMSLENLAGDIGVAYQQLQKYELGHNRISASTLYRIAEALQTPIDYFYEGLPSPGVRPGPAGDGRDALDQLLTLPGGLDLVRSLIPLPDRVRRRLAALLEDIAGAGTDENSPHRAPTSLRATN